MRNLRKQKHPFKSRLEYDFARKATELGLPYEYEADKIPFVRASHYLPDWKIGKDCYIETKGYLSPSNRANLLAFREQHPNITIFLLFQEPNNKLNRKSNTTYEEWATKHGFSCCGIRDALPRIWWEFASKGGRASISSFGNNSDGKKPRGRKRRNKHALDR